MLIESQHDSVEGTLQQNTIIILMLVEITKLDLTIQSLSYWRMFVNTD